MKNLIQSLIFIIATTSSLVKAQSNVSISDIQTPVSPGFVLADQTPSSVNRPTNTKGLVASLLSLNRGGAIEVSPYWVIPSKSRENLSYDDYINTIVPIRQTFSISATSFRSDTGSYLSVGGRFHIIRVYNKTKSKELSNELTRLLSVRPQELDLKAIEKARDKVASLRPDFAFEVAGAWLGYSQQNSFEQLGRSRTGVWANLIYKPVQMINVVALARYINNKTQVNFSKDANYFDLGASIGYESNNNNFSLNGEFVYRDNSLTKEKSQRISAVANYRITDQLYIVGSFGKNFSNSNNIIALLGINVGLNNQAISL